MKENLGLYVEKLNLKNIKLTEIFGYVSTKDFSVDEDEIQHIENYLNKRDNLYKSLLELDRQIKQIHISEEEKSTEEYISSKIIEQKNDELIKSILDLDEKHKIILQKIMNIVKKNIKSIKNLEKANENYFNVYVNSLGGNYFDSKR